MRTTVKLRFKQELQHISQQASLATSHMQTLLILTSGRCLRRLRHSIGVAAASTLHVGMLSVFANRAPSLRLFQRGLGVRPDLRQRRNIKRA